MLFEEIYGTTGMKKAARRLHYWIIKSDRSSIQKGFQFRLRLKMFLMVQSAKISFN